MQKNIIPPELKGKNTNLKNSITTDSKEEAVATYKRACKRLLNPAIWHKLAGAASAEFILTGDDAVEKNCMAKEGDYFKIDIPGPGSSTGDGYDWVMVEQVEDHSNPDKEEESCGMKLRASPNPGTRESDIAHFFGAEATSSFIIQRKGNTVTASYHGRNESPNTSTGKTMDNIRNTAVALGAMVGLSEGQWSALIKGLLEKETGG